MRISDLDPGDFFVIRQLPSNWGVEGVPEHAGMLIERFDIYPDGNYPSWSWRIMWSTPTPRCYSGDKYGMSEANLINMLNQRSSDFQKPSRDLNEDS